MPATAMPTPPTAIHATPVSKPGGLNFAAMARAKEVGGEAYAFQPKGVPVKAYEKPVSLFVGEKEYPLKNWRDLMIKTCDILAEKNLALLKDLAFRFGRNFLAATSDGMRDPRLHAPSGLFMELYMAPQGLLRHSQLLFHEAGYHDVWLVYLKSALAGKGAIKCRDNMSANFCPNVEQYQTFLYASGHIDAVTGTRPVALFFNGEEYPLNGEWKNLPAQVCVALERVCPGRLRSLVARGAVAGFAISEARFRRGQYVPEAQVWYEKNAPSREFVRQTRKLCILFGADLSHIKVTYVTNGAGESKTANRGAILEAVRRGRRALPESVGAGDLNPEVVNAFEADLMENYADGFDFRETSRRLVEGRVRKAMTEAVAKALQARMFERKDGLWFFIDKIATEEVRAGIRKTAAEWMADVGVVPLNRLGELLVGRSEHLDDEQALRDYVERSLSSDIGAGADVSLVGKRGNRFCFRASEGEDAARARFAECVRGILAERMDAVRVSELVESLPSVTGDWLVENVSDFVPDAIVEDLGDDDLAIKLVEFYYLPEDFGTTLADAVAFIRDNGEVLSSLRIRQELTGRLGGDIFDDYALSERSFRQLVTYFDPEHRIWKGGRLCGEEEAKGRTTLGFRETIEKRFQGLFSFDELYEFGCGTWKWRDQNRGWQRQELWRSFIRYDAETWSSVTCLMRTPNWAEIAKMVTATLKDLLGQRPFLSFAQVSRHTLDSLPTLVVDGREMPWTTELLASVAHHCLPGVATLNHAKGREVVATILVPPGTEDETDGLDYLLNLYWEQSRSAATVDGAFDFLHENHARMNFSRKLRDHIAAFLEGKK